MTSRVRIDRLDPDHSIGDYAEVMTEAFLDYPVMVSAFADTVGLRRDWIHRMVRESAEARRISGESTPVALMENKVVGGASVHFPGPDSGLPEWWTRFLEDAGPSATSFYEELISLTEAVPLPPHAYLAMLGVHPHYQGMGIGKALINHVAELAQESGAKGIALDTELEGNVLIYERCGFEVINQGKVREMPVWVMFRDLED